VPGSREKQKEEDDRKGRARIENPRTEKAPRETLLDEEAGVRQGLSGEKEPWTGLEQLLKHRRTFPNAKGNSSETSAEGDPRTDREYGEDKRGKKEFDARTQGSCSSLHRGRHTTPARENGQAGRPTGRDLRTTIR